VLKVKQGSTMDFFASAHKHINVDSFFASVAKKEAESGDIFQRTNALRLMATVYPLYPKGGA
jgi:hypothetical protein